MKNTIIGAVIIFFAWCLLVYIVFAFYYLGIPPISWDKKIIIDFLFFSLFFGFGWGAMYYIVQEINSPFKQ